MTIEDLLARRDMIKYRFAVQADIPHATLNDICSGKTKLAKCSAEMVYKQAKTLNVSIELLTEGAIHQAERERAYDHCFILLHTCSCRFRESTLWNGKSQYRLILYLFPAFAR